MGAAFSILGQTKVLYATSLVPQVQKPNSYEGNHVS